jgi:hypothetical protein
MTKEYEHHYKKSNCAKRKKPVGRKGLVGILFGH